VGLWVGYTQAPTEHVVLPQQSESVEHAVQNPKKQPGVVGLGQSQPSRHSTQTPPTQKGRNAEPQSASDVHAPGQTGATVVGATVVGTGVGGVGGVGSGVGGAGGTVGGVGSGVGGAGDFGWRGDFYGRTVWWFRNSDVHCWPYRAANRATTIQHTTIDIYYRKLFW